MAINSGGYDYQFVDESPQEILICKICLLVSRDPYLSVCCGHVFCKSCIDKTKQNTAIVKACPVCRSQEFTTVVNKQVERLVKSLSVFCTNKDKGCKWQGELNDINNHLSSSSTGCQFQDVQCTNECGKVLQRRHLKNHLDSECPYNKTHCKYCNARVEQRLINSKHKKECPKIPLPCPNKCKIGSIPRENLQKHLSDECVLQNVKCTNKCGIVLQRQYLSYHLKSECPCRKVKCQYCHTYNTYKFIEGQHAINCPKYPVFCSNRCGVTIPRKDINKHKNTCPLEKIDCMYHALGCSDIILRMNQKSHNEESVEKHLQMVLLELNTTKQKLATQLSVATDKLVGIQMELNNTRKELNCARRETADMQQTLISTQMELNSTKRELSNAERILTRNQEHFTNGISERQNCIEKDLYSIKRDSASISSRVNALEIVTHQIARLKHYFTLFPRKVTAIANISVYEAALIRMSESGDQTCPVILKMHEFTKFKENRRIWQSKTFYLYTGCKVCLHIDTSTCTNNQGPLLQLHLIEGPYNNKRYFSLEGELRLLLVNHDADGANLKLIHEELCAVRDHQGVISEAVLPVSTQNDQYCRDDTIMVWVSFSRHWPTLLYFLGCFLLMMIVRIVFELFSKTK